MKNIYVVFVALLLTCSSFGQLTGIKTIPGDYPTISAAITALNAQGVGAGGVTFNITAGYTETASNLIITATGTSANPILFQKSGTGANPLITASAGLSTTLDGIILFKGCDYITFNAIDLLDPATNITSTTQMEWGYALLKNSGTDGCQNVTISSCVITLQRIYGNSTGIYMANHTNASTTALTVTNVSGANSNNKFYANTIQNVNTGISITGFTDVSPYTYYDQNNDIGGSILANGNTIQDFGGVAATTSYGINVIYQNGCNISFNTINNSAGGGIASVYTLYGISHGASVNSNSTINNNTISLSQGNNARIVYHISSTISGTGTLNINNNVFQNSTMASGATGNLYCIYITGGPAVSTFTNNQFINCPTLATTASVYFISNSVSTPTITVTNNSVSNISKTSAGGTFYGYYNAGSPTSAGSETVIGNSLSGITLTGATTFYGFYGGTGVTTQNKTYSTNTVTGITGGSANIFGIYVTYGNTNIISLNSVNSITNGNGGTAAGAIYAFDIGTATSVATNIYSNNANGITNSNSGANYGLYIGGGVTINAYKNNFYGISGSAAGTLTYGIDVISGTNVYLYNNFFSDLRATIATGLNAVAGIYIAGGTNVGIYYNSIYLNAASSGTTFGSSGIYSSTTPILDLRSNIIDNVSNPSGAGGYTVAYRRSSTTLTTYSANSNNNDFYAGTPGASNLLFYDGTNAIQTLTAYKSLTATRDLQSITENPPFINMAVTPYNLHLNSAVATSCESGGIIVASPVNISTDYDGDARYPNPGYPNSVSYPAVAPDIGADEFAGIPLDVLPPVINYTPLSNTSSLTNRTLTSTIYDISGVPTLGIGVPVLYWKINAGSWNSSTGVYAGGNLYNFTFGSGVNPGDIVSYYIVAQDNATPTPFSGSYPLAGASGFTINPPAASTPPTTPSAYTIIGGLCGTYNVGVGQTYTTLTAAITDLNTKEITCAVIFLLTDNTYPSETFPMTINPLLGSSSVNTVTIRPASGKTPVITGSSTSSILQINGANYIIIDGSNSGGTDKSLTWVNTNSSANTYAIGFSNSGGTIPAKNNTIQNCIISSSNQLTNNTVGVYFNTTGGGYDNSIITNNTILSARSGIFFSGASTAVANNAQITNNIIGSTVDATSITYGGIQIQYANNTLISGNEIMGAPSGNTNYYQSGIYIGTGSTNTKIRKNKIHDWYYTGTGGWGNYGIYYGSDASTSTEISNNLIYLIKGDGYPSAQTDNPYGIYVATGGNCQIWSNSIYMTGSLLSTLYPGAYSACISINAGITLLDIRDNILKNSMQPLSGTPADFTYAIYSASANTAFSTINYNDYWVDGIGANIGYINSAKQATLAAWQTATGQDANSVNVDPAFISTSDLHTTATGLSKAGVYITMLTTDFSGVLRTNPPDIGAYQFSAIPLVTTTAATGVTCTTVMLNGTINASNATVTSSFDYGLTTAYGVNIPGVPGIVTGNSPTAVLGNLTGLTPNTLYHYRTNGISGGVTVNGNDLTFTTSCPPTAITTAATLVSSNAATLNGTINPQSLSSTVTFDYGLTTAYGTNIAGIPSPINGSTTTPVQVVIAGLLPGNTYHFRINGTNSAGTSNGNDMTFITLASAPIVVTTAATTITNTTATLNGTVIPNGATTAVTFHYGLTIAYGSVVAAIPSPVTGNTILPVSANLTGLTCNTLYHYMCVGVNSAGTTNGNDMTFTTGGAVAAAGTITGPTALCQGSTGAVYTVASIAGATGYNWTIPAGGTITSGANTNTITVSYSTSASSGNVTVYGTNSCMNGTSSNLAVTIYVLPVPTITGAASACINSTGNVYTTETGMTGYTWSVSSGGTITAGQGTRTINITWNATGAQTVGVNYTNGNGCTASSPTMKNITVNALPVPTLSGAASVCAGSTGNIYTSDAGMTNYSWTVSAGGTVTAGGTATSNTVTVTWNTTGSQTISVNYTNGNGCTAASPTVKNVTVNTLPVPTITGSGSVCAGATGVTYTTETGMTGYTWSVSSGGTITSGSGTYTVTVTWNNAGAQTVNVNYTNGNGCTASSPTVKNVTVNALPVPTITGLASVCAGSTGVNYTTETGMTGYTWSVSSGGTITAGSGSKTITVTWNTAGAQTVSINYTNGSGCAAASPIVKNITVYALPVPTITGAASVCAGSTGLTYTTESGMGAYIWIVSSGGTITGGAGTKTITVTWNTTGSQTVSVNYTDGNGCSAASPTVKNVTINLLPVPTITGSSSVCVGVPGNIYTTEPGMTNYLWSVSAGGTITSGGTSTANTVTITWNTIGSQTVSVNYTNGNGCTALSSTVKNITVNGLPVPTIVGSGIVCAGVTGITYSTETGMTNYSWVVSSGGTITAGAGSKTITVTWNTAGAQSVSVNYTNANGCTASTATIRSVTVNPLPIPTITGSGSVCVGTTGVKYATDAGMTGYNWSVSSGGTIMAGYGTDSITVSWNTAGAQTVSVAYTNSNGCTASPPTMKTVTVNPLPVPGITGANSICVGTTGVFYTTESGMTNYIWTISAGGTITSGAGTRMITVNWITAGAQTVSVSYTNTNGCTTFAPTVKNITVNPLPIPTITGASSVCVGTQGVTYTTEPGMTYYQWTKSAGGTITGGGTSTSNTITLTWTTTGSQSVSVNYTNSNGCMAASPTAYPVTVNPLPVPTITGNNNVCAGTTGVIYTTQAGMTNYLWNISSGGTITSGGTTTDNTVTVTWNTAGSQNVTVKYTNGNGCSAISPFTFLVTVKPLPTPTIIGPTPVCAGSTGNVYTTQSGMTNYIWIVSAGGTKTAGGSLTQNTVTVTWNTTGAQTVSVNYTGTNGCNASTATVYHINVNPLPVPTITGNSNLCTGISGTYTTQTGMTSYSWTVASGGTVVSGGTSTSSTITVKWNSAGADWVKVNYTNPNGCRAAAPTQYNITVHALPLPSITGNKSVCAGTTGTIYTTQTGMTNYLWTISTGGTITSGTGTNAITVTWNTAGSRWVKVNYTNANGCTATAPTQYTVTVNPIPVPSINGATNVCNNTTVTYMTDPGMANYVWTVSAGGAITSGNGTRTVTVLWSTAGSQTISVIYTNTSGCPVLIPTVKNVTVNPIPVPTISGPGSVCLGVTVTYSTQPGMTNYSWTLGGSGGIIYSGFNSSQILVKWTLTGDKTVSVNYSGAGGCRATSPPILNVNVHTCASDPVTGIEEELQPEDIIVYPNPNNGQFTISIRCSCEDNCTISIFNILGVRIYELKDLIIKGKSQQNIDLSDIPEGIYWLIFRKSDKEVVKKIVINK